MSHSLTMVEAVTLGIVQGLTEFLPISSTAHLRVVPSLLHWQDPGAAYSAVIQLGSVLAVFIYFYRDIAQITLGALAGLKARDYGCRDVRLAGAIVLGTIPVCVLGLLLKDMLEQDVSPLRSLNVIGGAAIFMGLMLLLAERLSQHKRTIDEMGAKDGLLVGCGQAMALVPGCSRSGSTLTVALMLGLKRAEAARFSFLLGIPAITLAGLFELKHMAQDGLSGESGATLAVGLIVSTVVSYLSIAWLIKYLQKHSAWVFVLYRLIFGAVVIYLCNTGAIH